MIVPLSDDDVARLTTLDVGTYRLLHSLLRASGVDRATAVGQFALKLDDTVYDPHNPDPCYVVLDLSFSSPTEPNLAASFGSYPQGLAVFLPDALRMHASSLLFSVDRTKYESDHAYLQEVERFFTDWLTGAVVVRTSVAGATPYKCVVERQGLEIWHARRLLWPYWAAKRQVVKCCRLVAPPTTTK